MESGECDPELCTVISRALTEMNAEERRRISKTP